MLDINWVFRYNISMKRIKKESAMKKIIASLVLIGLTATAQAGPYGHRHGGGSNWVAPLIVGGAVGYMLAQPRPQVVVTAMPQVAGVYIPTPSVVIPQGNGAYYGYGYQQQQVVPYGYHYENILDAYCNCYRVALVPN